MRINRFNPRLAALATLCLAVSCLAPPARVSAVTTFDNYQQTRTFTLPSSNTFGVMPDGRLVTMLGSNVLVETGVRSATFSSIGSIPGADIASFGPSFLRVSPDGTRIAIGNNGGASFSNYQVGVFTLSGLTGGWYSNINHFDANWYNNQTLLITAGSFGSPSFVTALNTLSPLGSPVNPTVVTNIGGSTAGVTTDSAGRLYTANGFIGSGPSDTGVIKAFDASLWQPALLGGTPADFENQGIQVAELLSGSPIGFDNAGNLYAAGGDFSNSDFGFVGLIRNTAIQSALLGGPPAGPALGPNVRAFDPDAGNPFNFYNANYNPATGELYVQDFGSSTVAVFAPVPEPVTAALCTLGVAALGLSLRRRRDAR